MKLTVERQLQLISQAWGRGKGYVFLPYIVGSAVEGREARLHSWVEVDPFKWPEGREKILQHMRDHQDDDLYWSVNLFSRKRRVLEFAEDEHCLWADLDEVDPRDLTIVPSIAWETSPGRWQALWVLAAGELQGASWPGNENQRLTHAIGADLGGWHTTKVLRVPGWANHKPEHRGGTRQGPNTPEELAPPPIGKLLWSDGPRYIADEFQDLPEVEGAEALKVADRVVEDEVDRVDRHEVWGRVRLLIPHTAREQIAATAASGDRSGTLWWLARCLADVGCSAPEIVALLRPTVWNKFAGRSDELRRLTIEAAKAIDQRTEAAEVVETDTVELRSLFLALKNVKPPRWLIQDIWTQGAVGFIAGEPKSFKSWFGLDMALSVATGLPFLNRFTVRSVGPVMYLQQEDPEAMVRDRLDSIWPGKRADKVTSDGAGGILWTPGADEWVDSEVPVAAYFSSSGESIVTLSDPTWQSWLDEKLSAGWQGNPYHLLIVDTLMQSAGDVEDTKAQQMTTKIFAPLKQLARKHRCGIVLVHHMRKHAGEGSPRPGQMLLGSVANHAWSESALYLKATNNSDKVTCITEHKSAAPSQFTVANLRQKAWEPRVEDPKDLDPDTSRRPQRRNAGRGGKKRQSKIPDLLKSAGPMKAADIAESLGISQSGVHRQLTRLSAEGKIHKVADAKWSIN